MKIIIPSAKELTFEQRVMGYDSVTCDFDFGLCGETIRNLHLPKNRHIFEDTWTTDNSGLGLPLNYCPKHSRKALEEE